MEHEIEYRGDVGDEISRPCRCRSQFCGRCSLSVMLSYREKLRKSVGSFRAVLMLTLTVTREVGAKEAYEMVQRQRGVAELMKKLRRRSLVMSSKFFYVIEFHRDGWPHWHVIVESRFIDKHDLQKMWGRGNVWVSAGPRGKGQSFESNMHAVNYVTKYLTAAEGEKQPFPDWVMDYRGNMRRFATSRGLMGDPKKKPPPKSDGEKRERVRMTPRERVKACGKRTNLLTVLKSSRGATKYVFVGSVDQEYDERFSDMSHVEIIGLQKRRQALEDVQLDQMKKRHRTSRAMLPPHAKASRRKLLLLEIHREKEQSRRNLQVQAVRRKRAFVASKFSTANSGARGGK